MNFGSFLKAGIYSWLIFCAGCSFDTTGISSGFDGSGEACGNDRIDPGEECDGVDLGGNDCTTIGRGYIGGTLACTGQCLFDVSGCEVSELCGNGVLDPGEDCDPPFMGTETCDSLGYYGGAIQCSEGCRYDLTDCENYGKCGDEIIQEVEECDTDQFGNDSCQVRGYYQGDLICNDDCTVDDSQCRGYCGDGVIDEGFEQCEEDDLGGVDCVGLGFSGGELRCLDCRFDTSLCRVGFGEFCTSDAQCDEGLCVTEAQYGWPGGFCTKYCTQTAGQCPEGSVCVTNMVSGGAVCMPYCTGGNSCRDGYFCWPLDGGSHACIPHCDDDSQCTDFCNVYRGYCNLTIEGDDNGASSFDGSNCKSGISFSVPTGYCFSFCNLLNPRCPSGDVCLNASAGGGYVGRCFKGCMNDDDCRPLDNIVCRSPEESWGGGDELVCRRGW